MSDSYHPVVRGRWIILVLFAALCAWLVPGAKQLQHDDDVLAFLPPEHPDVVTFRAVAERFGMLEVALVGVLPEAGTEGLLHPEPIAALRGLHTKLTEIEGVRLVLSLPAFPNARVADDVLVVDELVPASVTDPEVIAARALANPDAVGNVVSADGGAAAFIVFLRADTSAERFAKRAEVLAKIRKEVDAAWSGPKFYGGAPFVEHAASDSSRTDIEDLSPIVIGVLVVVSAVLLGSTTAAILNLLVTGLGVLLIVGAHGRFGEPFTIVSSTTPVMMVALGGAFGMHVLAGYQRLAGTPCERASAALRELWIPVVLSGVTTATAFFVLRAMPQVPMQRFGLVAGAGVLSLLVLALLVLPALLAVLPARLLPTRPNRVLPRPPAPPTLVLLAAALAGFFGASRMSADPDTAEVFDPRTTNFVRRSTQVRIAL
ncbi:MAG: MMPL family transporter [Myxococcota bacterium]